MHTKLRIVLVVAVFITASLFGVFWFQRYLLRSKASAAPPTASFAIDAINTDGSFDLVLLVNPHSTPFGAFDLTFSYDATKVSTDAAHMFSHLMPLSDLILGAGTGVNITNHTVRVVAARSTMYTGEEAIRMVKVTFYKKSSAALPLDFTWDPASVSQFEKVSLSYSGPTLSATPIPNTPIPTSIQPTSAFNLLTPVPTIMGTPLNDAATTSITEGDHLLYINSIASYPAPFRYEQPIRLERGTYHLTLDAKVFVRRGRGMVVALVCNEASCGTKMRNQTFYVSPPFPLKGEYSEFTDTITVPDSADYKEYMLRIFCEDGSECELSKISLEDAWGSERVTNGDFSQVQQMSDPRKQPSSWAADSTAVLYGSVDPAFGHNGSLMINNSIK